MAETSNHGNTVSGMTGVEGSRDQSEIWFTSAGGTEGRAVPVKLGVRGVIATRAHGSAAASCLPVLLRCTGKVPWPGVQPATYWQHLDAICPVQQSCSKVSQPQSHAEPSEVQDHNLVKPGQSRIRKATSFQISNLNLLHLSPTF